MKVHQVKLQSRFMSMKVLGVKNWELRVNDRGYCEGDYVHYIEVDESGREEPYQRYPNNLYRIDSILGHEDFATIPDGFVIWNECDAEKDPLAMRDALLRSIGND